MADNSSEKSSITFEDIISYESSCSSDGENRALTDAAMYLCPDYFNSQNHASFAMRKGIHNLDSSIKRGTQLNERITNSQASNYAAFDQLYPLNNRSSSLACNNTAFHPPYPLSGRPSSLSSNYSPLFPLNPVSNQNAKATGTSENSSALKTIPAQSSLASNNTAFNPLNPLRNRPSSLASNYTASDNLNSLNSVSNPTSEMPRSYVSSTMNTACYIRPLEQNAKATGTGENSSTLKTIPAISSLASNNTAFDPLNPLRNRPSSLASNYTVSDHINSLYSVSNPTSGMPRSDASSTMNTASYIRPLGQNAKATGTGENSSTLKTIPAQSSLASNNTAFNPLNPLSNGPSSLASNYTASDHLNSLNSISSPTLEMPRSDVSSTMNTANYIRPLGLNSKATETSENSSALKTIPALESNVFPALKEIVHLTNSTLHPPNPNAPSPTTRDKPLGCKTVFVGGLPETATEEIIKEIFENCGTILTIRMGEKDLCHVRFSNEAAVENAIRFSGYRLTIENKDEPTYSGRLHVDYAQAGDHLYDYENNQQDHHKEQNNCRPITPPVVLSTDHKVTLIWDKLKNEDIFSDALSLFISLCEGGNCTKENASSFISMIQSIHGHAVKLHLSKVTYEEQLNEIKKKLKRIVLQFTEIEKVYKAATLQKCWDHFTEDQKYIIEILKRRNEKFKNTCIEKAINECEDREMDLHDDENDITNELNIEQLKQEIHRLREEGDTLKCQLEGAQNKIMAMQSDHTEKIKQKDDIIQKKYLDNNQMLSKNEAELSDLQACKYRIVCEKGDNEKSLKELKMKLKQKDCESAAVQKVLQDLNEESLKMRLKCIKYESELKELRAFKSRTQRDLPFLTLS